MTSPVGRSQRLEADEVPRYSEDILSQGTEESGQEIGLTQLNVLPINDDDPQVDWQTQADNNEIVDGDDNYHSEENDQTESPHLLNTGHTLPAASPHLLETGYKLPAAIQRAENAHSQDSQAFEIHARYWDFLHKLSCQTATEVAEGFAKRSLPIVAIKVRSIAMDKVDDAVDLYAFALVVYVWQLVCLGIQHGSFEKSVSTICSAHFLSAHCILKPFHNVPWQEFKFAVQHWEERLSQMRGDGNWVLRNLFMHMNEVELAVAPPDEIALQYLEALEHEGLIGLAKAIWARQEVDDPPTEFRRLDRKPEEKTWALRELVAIMASMDQDLLKALIDGSLPRKAELLCTDVCNALNNLDQKGYVPSIYLNCVCDRNGFSPTPTQWQGICELMLTYIKGSGEGNRLARKVDQLIYPSEQWKTGLADRGLRRYTEWRSYLINDDLEPSSRREKVEYFAGQMKERITKEINLGRAHVPLAAPVIEIGYTINPRRRLAAHRHHRSSNYIMNLAEALFQYAYPELFRLQQRVIYTCWRFSHAWLGEILFTQLGQGYTKGGRGFSHYAAGFSNGSAYRKLSAKDWTRLETASSDKAKKGIEEAIDFTRRRKAELADKTARRHELVEAEKKQMEAATGVVDVVTAVLRKDVSRFRDSS